jgi:hypothetical protein
MGDGAYALSTVKKHCQTAISFDLPGRLEEPGERADIPRKAS